MIATGSSVPPPVRAPSASAAARALAPHSAPTPAPAAAPAQPAPPPTPRARRIGRFLTETETSALQETRFLTATWMGDLAGMAIGASVAGPLGLALGNLYVITGGTALCGGLGALVGYEAEKAHLGSKLAALLHGRKGSRAAPASGTAGQAPVAGSAAAARASGSAGQAPVAGSAAAAPAPSPSAAVGIEAAAAAAAGVVRATPSFVYPAVTNATAAERAVIMKALDTLPLHTVASAQQIAVVNGLEPLGASGLTQPLFFRNQIMLGRDSIADAAFGHSVTIHEMGHAMDFTRGFGPFGSLSQFGPWGKAPFYFDPQVDTPGQPPYSATNRFEDFAQTHMAYYTDPKTLQATAPGKYAAMQHFAQPTPMDRLLDRPGVRDFGRQLGAATEKLPYLRTALDLGGALIAPAVLHNGARHLEQAVRSNDPLQRFQGKMRLAAGMAYLFKTAAPLGLVASFMQWRYQRQIQKGTLTVAEANRKADRFLAVAMGPVGTSGMAALQALEREGIAPQPASDGAAAPQPASAGVAATQPAASGTAPGGATPQAAAPKSTPPGATGLVSATAATLIGSYLGQTAGALVGTALGGVTGAITGAWWGKVGGALLGLGAVSLRRARRADRALGVGGLTKRDRLHLAGVAGGAALGGALGTAAGSWGGGLLGGAIGGAVAGPAGAAVGALAGRLVGVVGASYAGARAGASLGSRVAPDDGS